MTDRPKAKPSSNKNTNDERPNRKSFKKGLARGSRPTRLSSLDKVLLGGGSLRTFKGVGHDPSTQTSGKSR